jgi:hypothetical protein
MAKAGRAFRWGGFTEARRIAPIVSLEHVVICEGGQLCRNMLIPTLLF